MDEPSWAVHCACEVSEAADCYRQRNSLAI
jgi:hypothetical protein